MMSTRPLRPLLFALTLIAAPAVAQSHDHTRHDHSAPDATAAIDAAIAAPHRSAANRARDPYRHPQETLRFFGLTPDMTVVEIFPGGGWYTEILAPVLRDHGTYYAAHYNPVTEGTTKAVTAYKAKLATEPALYDRVQVTSFGKDHYDALAPAGSADMVLTFRNVHNWVMGGYGPQAFQAFFRVLKPGGVLGVVEHRLPESRPAADQETSGYIKQSEVIRLAEAAGFKLVASSEINANPKDTADHPGGVWSLPPSFRLGDQDRAKYAAIGESDRMTLKFVKPK